MDTWLRSKLFWGILLAGGVGLVFCCHGRDQHPRLPPADDAFLSYFQAAYGLANLLLHPAPLMPGENRQEQLAMACEELKNLQAAAAALPPDELDRLVREHEKVVAEVGAAWRVLAHRQSKSRQSPGVDWPRVEAALRLSRDLSDRKK
jgi:hypothetical protein